MNKIDLRSPKRKAKDAAYAKLPAAIICKPLQFIGHRTAVKVTDPVTGIDRWEPSPDYKLARVAADHGNGAYVKHVARRVAATA